MICSNLLSDSYPTYAVVDITRKKKKTESDHEISADTVLYAVVNKKKKKVLSKEVYKNDHNIYLKCGIRKDRIVCCETGWATAYVFCTARPNICCEHTIIGNKNKSLTSAGTVFQICLSITIITAVFLVFAYVISAAVCYTMISGLRSEITSAQRKATSNNVLMTLCNVN